MYVCVLNVYVRDEGDGVAAVAAASMLRFNAGGHINHSIFWQNLAPQGKCGEPSGSKLSSLSLSSLLLQTVLTYVICEILQHNVY